VAPAGPPASPNLAPSCLGAKNKQAPIHLPFQGIVFENARGMRDLQNPKLMWLKGVLFLFIGTGASVMLWLEAPTLKNAILLALVIWGFCRAYYFAFYVLERYVDPQFRFSGLGSLLRYLLRRGASKTPQPPR